RLPAVLVAVLRGVGGIQLVGVQVFLVDVEDGQAEGDRAVVAERDAGQRRLARADHIEAGRGKVRDGAQARRGGGALRRVRQERTPGGRLRGRDGPAVAPFRG